MKLKSIPLLLLPALVLLVACGSGSSQTSTGDDATATSKATVAAEATPKPTPEPTPEPTPAPTSETTPEPTPAPTPDPTPEPTPAPTSETTPEPTPAPTPEPTPEPTPATPPFIRWSSETGSWAPSSAPPECGPLEEMFDVLPIDPNILTTVGRPGRTGGNGAYYVAHGLLRANNTPHDQIEVKFPANGFSLYSVNRRLEDYYIGQKRINDGVEQVKLEFHHPCGISIMIDHIAQLTDRWMEIIKDIPVTMNDSRTVQMPSGQYWVESGEVLGHAIGHVNNIYLDFGVYDLRNKNDSAVMIAKDWPEYINSGGHGICWSGLFGSQVQEILEGLYDLGSESDYCN